MMASHSSCFSASVKLMGVGSVPKRVKARAVYVAFSRDGVPDMPNTLMVALV